MQESIKKIIPSWVLNLYHYILSFLGALIYNFPSKKIKVIGVTGTKGKTTTVLLISHILRKAGFKTGWISSATISDGQKEWLNPWHMAMPGRFTLKKLIFQMLKNNCRYCVLEVSSEGILQHRQKFINFEAAVFTNLRPEHLEAHGGFENYRKTKGKFFDQVKNIHVLNLDDENVNYFLKFKANRKYGFTLKKDKNFNEKNLKTIVAKKVHILKRQIKFSVEDFNFQLSLLGKANLYNALGAISVAISQGISLQTCQRALAKIDKIPGRAEIVIEKPFWAIVDYAHTPDSFEAIFEIAKNLLPKKIICVFGAMGGGRDKWKRKVLGNIAAKNSNIIILTTEDPCQEDPKEIIEMIKEGIGECKFPNENLYEILDRREAIKKSLTLAKKGDVVLILGKGCEQLLLMGNQKIPWDDRKVVIEEFQKLNYGKI